MDPLIDFATLEERLGHELDGAEAFQATAFLDDASALVRRAAGDDFLDDEGALDVPPDIIPVMVRVVNRALENPNGLDGETQGNYAWRARASGDGVYLTAADRRDVRRAVGKVPAGSIRLEGHMPVPLPDGGAFVGDDLPLGGG